MQINCKYIYCKYFLQFFPSCSDTFWRTEVLTFTKVWLINISFHDSVQLFCIVCQTVDTHEIAMAVDGRWKGLIKWRKVGTCFWSHRGSTTQRPEGSWLGVREFTLVQENIVKTMEVWCRQRHDYSFILQGDAFCKTLTWRQDPGWSPEFWLDFSLYFLYWCPNYSKMVKCWCKASDVWEDADGI